MTKSYMNKKLMLLLLLGSLLLGCRAKKKPTEMAPVEVSSLASLRMEQLFSKDFRFNELSISGSITANMNGQRFSSPMSLKLLRDQKIWMSIKPMLGIEAFRLLITPDSVFVIDRLNRQFMAEPFSWLSDITKAPLSFAVLQDLLLNNSSFLRGIKPSDAPNNQLQLSNNQLQYLLLPDERGDKLKQIQVKQEAQQLQITYLSNQEVAGASVPKSMQMQLEGGEKGAIDIIFSKFAIENGQSYPFSIPNSYSRVD